MCECIKVHGVVSPSKGCKECFPNKPHIHAELIKAWADGAVIERYAGRLKGEAIWNPCPKPTWDSSYVYRIKPTPKPDIVKWANLNIRKDIYNSLNLRVQEVGQGDANVKVIFDGETEELKEVIVL